MLTVVRRVRHVVLGLALAALSTMAFAQRDPGIRANIGEPDSVTAVPTLTYTPANGGTINFSSGTATLVANAALTNGAGTSSVGSCTLSGANAGNFTVQTSTMFTFDQTQPGGTTTLTCTSTNPGSDPCSAASSTSAPLTGTLNLTCSNATASAITATLNCVQLGPILNPSWTVSCPANPGATFSIDDVTQIEGNSGTSTFTFTVTRGGNTTGSNTVDVATSNGTATTADSDYVANSTTLSFTAGQTSKTFAVTVNGDTKFEPTETFNVNLSNATGASATISDNLGVGTITNDDTQPTISIADVTQAEGNAGTSNFVFAVTLSNASSQTITVDYATADVSATAGSDYTAASGTLSFSPGVTSQNITVVVNGDSTVEPDETFNVNLSNPSNATIADNQGVGTITNDDVPASFAIDDVTQIEGNAGTSTFAFTVTRSGGTSTTQAVDVATSDVTATTADSDYVASSTTLTFTAGQTTKTFNVTVNGDTKFENTETFNVNLSNATNGATISDNLGLGTITNDDGTPAISINDVTQAEGNAGTSNFVFTVSLSNPSFQTITVDYATANNTATAGSDYTATSGTLTFTPGNTTQTITVLVNGDTTVEANETFNVNLSNPSNATIADNQGVGTITNDDLAPSFSVNDVTQIETNGGTTTFAFTVTRSGDTTGTNGIDVATSDGTATVADGDYVANSTTFSFTPGQTTKTFNVTVNGDTKFEPNETFNVNLTNATGAGAVIVDNLGVGTITNDDTTPAISITDVTQAEGNAATSNFVFAVTLSNTSASTITVNYATSNGTATAGSDYVATSGTLTFTTGVTSQNVTVVVNGDTTVEANETFNVNLSGASNATIADNLGVGTISNDDSAFSINDVTQNEGNAGTTSFNFTVTRSGDTSGTQTVDAATSDGTATTADSDYAAQSSTLSFGVGVATRTFTVLVNGDTKTEPNETFNVNLSNATGGASISDNLGVGTITNDDATPTISINDVTQVEGNAGTSAFVFTVSLSNPSASTVTVSAATANGTATAGSDYVAIVGQTVTFNPAVTSQTVSVTVNGDTTFEPNETFFVNLTSPVNATIADNQGLGTISNDDPGQPEFSAAPAPGARSLSGIVGASLTDVIAVSNVGDPTSNLTVTATMTSGTTLTVAPGTAGAGIGQGGSQNFTVTCNSGTAGVFSDTLTFTTNDAQDGVNETSVQYTYTCTVSNVPPNLTYNPTPGSTIGFAGITNAGDTGTASITVTPSGGAGAGATATTTVNGCSIGAISGPASFGSVAGVNLSFVGSTNVQQMIPLSCTSGVSVTTATLTCTETRGANAPVARAWPLSCAAGSASEFASTPAPGLLSITTPAGTTGTTTVTVTNLGTANLTANATGLSGVLGVAPAGVQTIAPMASRVFTVSCNSATSGTFSQTLNFATNDGGNIDGVDETSVNFPVTCTVQDVPPSLAYAPSPMMTINFTGIVNAGDPGTATIAVTPSGGAGAGAAATTRVDNCSIGGVVGTGSFGAVTGQPLVFVGNTVTPQNLGLTCTSSATLTTGTLSCTETRGGAAPTTNTWPLSCQAGLSPEYASTPAAGSTLTINTSIGTPASTTVTVNNLGTAPLNTSATGLSGQLSVLPAGMQGIAVGGSLPYTVSCAATQGGSFSQTLTITSNDIAGIDNINESSNTYTVVCNVASPEFASVPLVGSTVTIVTPFGTTGTANVVVSNPGTLPLTVTPGGLSGLLSVAPGGAQTVAAGGSLSLTVSCNATQAGQIAQLLTLTTNDTGGIDGINESSVTYPVACFVTQTGATIPTQGRFGQLLMGLLLLGLALAALQRGGRSA